MNWIQTFIIQMLELLWNELTYLNIHYPKKFTGMSTSYLFHFLCYLNRFTWCTWIDVQRNISKKKNEMNIERGVPKNYARCHIIRSGSNFLNEKSNFYSLEDLVEKENKTHTFGLMRCWYHNVLIEEISTLSMSYFFGCISRDSTIMTRVALLIPSIIRWTWKISMNNIKNQKDWEMEQNERGGKKRFTEAHLIETLYES